MVSLQRGGKTSRVATIKKARDAIVELFFDLRAMYKLNSDKWDSVGQSGTAGGD
jgi:hypothetical protein